MWFLFCRYERTSLENLLEMLVSCQATPLVGLESLGLSTAGKHRGEHAGGATHVILRNDWGMSLLYRTTTHSLDTENGPFCSFYMLPELCPTECRQQKAFLQTTTLCSFQPEIFFFF